MRPQKLQAQCPKIQPYSPPVLNLLGFCVSGLASGVVLVGLSKDIFSLVLAILGSRPLCSKLVTLIRNKFPPEVAYPPAF